MLRFARLLGVLIISGIQTADAHGRGDHNHHDHDHDDMNHRRRHQEQKEDSLRRLDVNIFANTSMIEVVNASAVELANASAIELVNASAVELANASAVELASTSAVELASTSVESTITPEVELASFKPCKDGEPAFTVGNVTYACLSDFHQKGGVCGTRPMPPDQKVKADEQYQAWKEKKKEKKEKKHQGDDWGVWTRRLGGCGDCVDWSTTIITIPTYFHVIHSGTTGKQYTYASNPAYIQNQIKAINFGFRGLVNPAFTPYPSRSYPRYTTMDSDSKIQFCLAGTTATDNASWYQGKNEIAMKTALKKGGAESLNVYVNTAAGYLGYAYFPQSNDFVQDGIVILNDSMPGGSAAAYNEGDTLTHEAGHWLELEHTHEYGCSGPGDYMNLASPSTNYSSVKACESTSTFGCPVNLNNCVGDGGNNPIHNFMAYSDDNCMDQFTPGQKMKVQQAWETYRHKVGYSELISLAADGYSCLLSGTPFTTAPTLAPTLAPTAKPSTRRPTAKPSTRRPTKKPTTKKLI